MNGGKLFTSVRLFLCLSVLTLCLVEESEASGVRVCGRKLIRILKVICQNCFSGPGLLPLHKRTSAQLHEYSEPENLQDLLAQVHNGEDDPIAESEDWFRFKRSSASQGISTECCEKRCKYSYLKSFCCDEEERRLFSKRSVAAE